MRVFEERRRERETSLPILEDIVRFEDLKEEFGRLCGKIADTKSNDHYNRSIKDLADYVSGLPDQLGGKIKNSALKPEEASLLLASLFYRDGMREEILGLKVNPVWSNIRDFCHIGVKKELRKSFARGFECPPIVPVRDYIEALELSVQRQFAELKRGWEKKTAEEYEEKKRSGAAEIDQAEEELGKLSSFEKEMLKNTRSAGTSA